MKSAERERERESRTENEENLKLFQGQWEVKELKRASKIYVQQLKSYMIMQLSRYEFTKSLHSLSNEPISLVTSAKNR